MQTLQEFLRCTSKRTNLTWYPQTVDTTKDHVFITDGVVSIHYQYNEELNSWTYRGGIYKLSVLVEVVDSKMYPIQWGANSEMWHIFGGYEDVGDYKILDITVFSDSDKAKIANDFNIKSWYELLSIYPLQ